MITTIIFDMDGTVLNTLEDLHDSIDYILRRYDMPVRTLDETRRFVGNGIRRAIELSCPEGTSSETVDRMTEEFIPYYDAHCLDKTGPYEGILGLMKTLKDAGYKLAIVSNKVDSAVKELTESFFGDYVTVSIGERPGVKRKPAPDTVYMALEELGSTAEESVYIGDSDVDLATAQNSGLPCISVLWGFRDRELLESLGATHFAETPDEIPGILKTL